MKLKTKPLRRRFKPVRLYKDDLKMIYDIIAEHSNEIQITTEKYEFNDWKDFIENAKSLKSLGLYSSGSSPKIAVRISIYQTFTVLDCSWSDEHAASYTFLRLSDIISNLEVKTPFLFRMSSAIIYPTLLTLWGFFAKKYLVRTSVDIGYLILLVLTTISLYYLFHMSKIYLNLREDNPSFFKRNKDALIVNAIVAIASAIITVLITNALKK
jgi:hypothetical protein